MLKQVDSMLLLSVVAFLCAVKQALLPTCWNLWQLILNHSGKIHLSKSLLSSCRPRCICVSIKVEWLLPRLLSDARLHLYILGEKSCMLMKNSNLIGILLYIFRVWWEQWNTSGNLATKILDFVIVYLKFHFKYINFAISINLFVGMHILNWLSKDAQFTLLKAPYSILYF